jgi:crotonobetainyl-CoA:carnitine CoA-transferase CaiB-like acyl-CoA transferase
MQATMSRTQGVVGGPAPCLGEHTWYVLESILGLDADTIAALLVDEVAEITG